ncbi:MAG: YdcF family protein [Acidimicrobiales bacterium]
MTVAPLRVALRIFGIAVAAVLVYLAVSLLQVWLTSREYDPHPAAAIMVMGAAQYNGVPSPDLQARLDEALLLFRKGDSKLIVLTGGKEKGDRFTEAQAGARYLTSMGVPATDILQAGGNNTYENVVDALPELRARHASTVLVTTDPFHEDRSMAISSSMGLEPSPTPTRTSPIRGWSTVPYFLKEAVGVGLGRIIGFGHLDWLHDA